MARVRVVTDSSCDLRTQVATELDIDIVPLTIRFGTEEFLDRQDLTPKEFWARCAASPELPETAAPPPGAFEEAFRRAAAAGADGIACLTLSSRLSATFQSAQVAAKAVEGVVPVRVIDSLSLTLGLGALVVEAARQAAAGSDLDEVVRAVRQRMPRMRVYGALDTLENLKKGGRVGGAQAFVGSLLSIKPIIEVRNGVVEPESRQRTRSRALGYLIDKVREHGTVEQLGVMHADAPDIDDFLERLRALYPHEEILVGDIGPVIGTHCGPRAVGVTFLVPA